ncbi:MAG: 4Fe-4S binding protein [Clostridia bacterium]|nr:4Fe-4S binding protein [Clostridia bacterium]
MIRKIIRIDEEKCNGCGLCASACHEGAIEMVNGKAKLVRENFCDGFGDCLPACPTGAISFEEREAPEYDEAAVKRSKEEKHTEEKKHPHGGCPGSAMMSLRRAEDKVQATDHPHGGCPGSAMMRFGKAAEQRETAPAGDTPVSRLGQWPCQIKLVPTNAPFFDGAKLLIAADCTAYAYANMHEQFMRGKVTVIGCPKLDAVDYTEKLTAIIRDNDVRSVTIVRMEVPCCGGLQRAAEAALKASGKFIPWQVVTISRDGRITD